MEVGKYTLEFLWENGTEIGAMRSAFWITDYNLEINSGLDFYATEDSLIFYGSLYREGSPTRD